MLKMVKYRTVVTLEGKSLVSSAELTAKAFSQGILGELWW